MTAVFTSPAGSLVLERSAPAPTGSARSAARNKANGASLKAWDAADELLLHYAWQYLADKKQPRVLLIDDNFGALTFGMAPFKPLTVADSAVLAAALGRNLELNPSVYAEFGVAPVPLSWLDDELFCPAGGVNAECATGLLRGAFDLVVLRIPRYGEYLAWLLRRINGLLADDGVLLAGGMIKHLPDRGVEVFAQAVVTEQVYPAHKKARVVQCRKGDEKLLGWPAQWRGYSLITGVAETQAFDIKALPAVFAREQLDIGTRVLLPWVTRAAAALVPGARVLDLACGNGALGLTALAANKHLELTFSDVSSQAVISAAENVAQAYPGCDVRSVHADGVAEGCGEFDLILLNPPFHEGGVVGDHIALSLFAAARRHLRPGGRLLLVGNRHLGYHRSLGRFFARVRQLDAKPKFVVLEACPDQA